MFTVKIPKILIRILIALIGAWSLMTQAWLIGRIYILGVGYIVLVMAGAGVYFYIAMRYVFYEKGI